MKAYDWKDQFITSFSKISERNKYILFKIAQDKTKTENIKQTRQLLTEKELYTPQLLADIQQADPTQDKRMMKTIAQWVIDKQVQQPNEHTEDIKDFMALKKLVKDKRILDGNKETIEKKRHLLLFDPIGKHYGEIQQQNNEMKKFLRVEDPNQQIVVNDEGLNKFDSLSVGNATYNMYKITSKQETQHPLFKENGVTYCVMSNHFSRYDGPPYYIIMRIRQTDIEQFGMIIPGHMRKDPKQALRDSTNQNRMSSNDIVMLREMIKKAILDSGIDTNIEVVQDLFRIGDRAYFNSILPKNENDMNEEDIIGLLQQRVIDINSWDYGKKVLLATNDPYIAYEARAAGLKSKRFVEVIARDAEYAFFYAKEVLKGHNIPDIILQSIAKTVYYSYCYVDEVLHGHNIPDIILQSIARDAYYALNYAQYVLKWKSVPDIIVESIAKDANASLRYAIFVRNIPDIILQSIAKDAHSSHVYAKEVLKGHNIPDVILEGIAKNRSVFESFIEEFPQYGNRMAMAKRLK